MKSLLRRVSVVNCARCSSYSTQPREMKSFTVFMDRNESERRNSLLGPSKEYPLPGQVTCKALFPAELKQSTSAKAKPEPMYYTLNFQQIANSLSFPTLKFEGYRPEAKVKEICAWNVKIDLVAVECPTLLKKDLIRLFPDAKLKGRRLTLVNFYEDTSESPDAPDQTDVSEKADSFILAANAVCRTLRSYGYWADFIDPNSGASRLNADSYKRLMNQNTKFELSGYNVEDVDCKVVSSVSLEDRPSKAIQDVIIGV
ncbi:Methylmalonic aciduria and homocystinuria type D-like protein, mitochondrial [Aphelenchoides fujianensis]|nr:Methylmalonic aciduria and homocystinuria type D-like protein, mitochondrial [Aphelenchoides fujianensis]